MLRDNIKPFIPRIVSRELTNRAVARELKVSEARVCRVLKELKVVRESLPDRNAARALIAERRAFRAETAANHALSIEEAARIANCSTRTIYRLRK